jgi:peptide chain release factor 2
MSIIEARISESDFWSNSTSAQTLIQELKALKSIAEPFIALKLAILENIELISISDEIDDAVLIADIEIQNHNYEKRLQELEIKTFFAKDEDSRNALLSIHAGAGGVDAMDWAARLERMYQRWFTKAGFEWEIIEHIEGEAGIKRSVIEVRGLYAYGYLRSEVGVHRICHISKFDTNHKKQTSFASVDVVPLYPEIDLKINECDLKIETMRSGVKAGGQGMQTADSAVRITHIPTETTVRCESQRSQMQNKKKALQLLTAKLKDHESKKVEREISNKYNQKTDIAFGHQIRSYIVEPYQLVTDHRSGYKTSNIEAVLDGDLTTIIEAYLRIK